jgi:hypothetical protein
MNFESTADPQKYLDEVQNSLKKHKDLEANFDRFIQKYFEDNDKEQMFTNFITRYPDGHAHYMTLAMNYNYFLEHEDH